MTQLPDSKRINPKFLYYDYELVDCFNAVKNLYDIFKRVKKRFDRKDTLTVSKSVADFLQLQKDADLYPYILYDFKCNTVRVCVIQHSKRYYVYVSAANPEPIQKKFKAEWLGYDFFGNYDRLKDSLSLFLSIVSFCSMNIHDVEIPF